MYNGPLDLLLYLIRREEVDIYDIPIARITEQYISYVEVLKGIDPNAAGEFLVLAATLIEIKTRMLLPVSSPKDAEQSEAEIDPRAELVRQLLEYKEFKDAAGDLSTAHEAQSKRFPRGPVEPVRPADQVDFEDVQVWDLLDAFSRLMESIGKAGTQQQIIYDDTPVELHSEDILDRLRREGPTSFSRIFEGRTLRGELVGLFLALLELIRQGKVFAAQEKAFGQIHVSLNPNPPAEKDAHGPLLATDEPGAGEYIHEPGRKPPEDDDDTEESGAVGS